MFSFPTMFRKSYLQTEKVNSSKNCIYILHWIYISIFKLVYHIAKKKCFIVILLLLYECVCLWRATICFFEQFEILHKKIYKTKFLV